VTIKYDNCLISGY